MAKFWPENRISQTESGALPGLNAELDSLSTRDGKRATSSALWTIGGLVGESSVDPFRENQDWLFELEPPPHLYQVGILRSVLSTSLH